MSSYRRHWSLPCVACLLWAAGLAVAGGACRAGNETNGQTGGAVVDFRLPTTDGRQLGPGDFRGRVVVIDFWATWCNPCRAQERLLEEVQTDLDGRSVQFLAVNVGEPEEVVQSWVKENPFPYPVLMDPEDRVSSQLEILALPTLLVLDKRGEVVLEHVGLIDRSRLHQAIDEAEGT